MRYTLINSRPSPYGRKIAVALHEKNLLFDVVHDEPWNASSRTGDNSPLRQLPILLAANGEAIYDSSYILEWLELMHPLPALLPADVTSRLHALKLKMLGERLMEIAQSVIFESHRTDPSDAWLARQFIKIEGGLTAVEALLDEQPPQLDAPIHLGHIALASTFLVWEFAVTHRLSPDIEQFRWRGKHPRITRLTHALHKRPSFIETEPGMMNVDIAAQMS